MSSRLRSLWPVFTLAVLAPACGGGGGGGGGGNGTGPDVDFAPTSNTTLTGNVTYKSISIPAGVTVTVSANAVITVVGDVTVAGTLIAPCHSLTLSADGNVTISGQVQNVCTDDPGEGVALVIIGKTTWTLQGATLNSSGDISVVNDPADVAAPVQSVVGAPREPRPAATSWRCKSIGTTVNASPLTRNKAANGTPTGANGKSGATRNFGCGYAFSGQTGGSLLMDGTTVNGGSGGDGGDGTSLNSTPSKGGDGGPPGAINITADEDIDIRGTVTINGGNGGAGGAATSTGSPGNPGVSVTATGGKGAGLKPKNFNAPVIFQAGGAITQTGTLNVVLGRAGAGGLATATGGAGNPGNPGANGGDATANGGDGGASIAVTINASGAVTLNGTVNLSGGAGGNGGGVLCTAGNGGAGNAPAALGGVGGKQTCRAGRGGNGQPGGNLRATEANDPPVFVTLNSPGGNAGNAQFNGGNGGVGGSACNPPGTGGTGGKGGDVSGGDGDRGIGTPNGTAGTTTVANAANGGKGGDGSTPGGGGAAGGNGLSHGSGVTGPFNITGSFTPGSPGAVCGSAIVNLVFQNGEQATRPWTKFIFRTGTDPRQSLTIDATGSVTVPMPTAQVPAEINIQQSIGNDRLTLVYYFRSDEALELGPDAFKQPARGSLTTTVSGVPNNSAGVAFAGSMSQPWPATNTSPFSVALTRVQTGISAVGGCARFGSSLEPLSGILDIYTFTPGGSYSCNFAGTNVKSYVNSPVTVGGVTAGTQLSVAGGLDYNGMTTTVYSKTFSAPTSPYWALNASDLPAGVLQWESVTHIANNAFESIQYDFTQPISWGPPLPPTFNNPTVTINSIFNGYYEFAIQITTQTQYSGGWAADYTQANSFGGTNEVVIFGFPRYFGSTVPAMLTLRTPTATSLDVNYMPKPPGLVNGAVEGFGFNPFKLPVAGETRVFAGRINIAF